MELEKESDRLKILTRKICHQPDKNCNQNYHEFKKWNYQKLLLIIQIFLNNHETIIQNYYDEL